MDLWRVLAETELQRPIRWGPAAADLFTSLQAPEIYAAEIDCDDTVAGRGMQPEPTYPPPPPEDHGDWRRDPDLRPHLERYPVLEDLLTDGGQNAVYGWAGLRPREADAFALWTAGFTDAAIAEFLALAEETVVELIGRADWRIKHALRHLDRQREAVDLIAAM